MKLTNRSGLPQPLLNVIALDEYSRGEARVSVTQLIDSPRIAVLQEVYDNELETDAADRVFALFGTALHQLIEKGAAVDGFVKEERVFTDVLGWVVSGGIDVQETAGRGVILHDWKTCTSWAVMQGKQSWEFQLNMYRTILERSRGLIVTGLKIGAFIRDWRASEARINSQYPQSPFQTIHIPLWSREDGDAYLEERVRLHQEAARLWEWGEELPECTAEEMWEQPGSWAVIKDGGERASRVFDNEAEAIKFADYKQYCHVVHRPGVRTRCERYCPAASVCTQYSRYLGGSGGADQSTANGPDAAD